jgi:hypothetical protein
MIMSWNTNNTSTGSSAANQAMLPLISTGTSAEVQQHRRQT